MAAVVAAFAAPLTASEFNTPWTDSTSALVLDPFYDNPIDWEQLQTEPRVVAIIHQATKGTTRLDPTYVARRQEARRRGYLWGSYHYGLAGNPEQQADHYIDTVKPAADELIALDLEDARSTTLMNADEAILFIERVKARTGRYPVLYTNHDSASLIAEKYRETVLAKVPLWYARFLPTVTDFPTGAWPSYTLWQFSSEIRVQIRIPGTRSDMDVSVFHGSIDQLKAAWPLTRSEAP